LADGEFVDEITDRALGHSQQLEDPPSVGFSEHVEGGDHSHRDRT
jgi:hypothetical protein